MPDYEKYENFLHDRGVNLSKKDLDSLMSLLEAVSDSAAHFVKGDCMATRLLVQIVNEALQATGAELRLKIDIGCDPSEGLDSGPDTIWEG